MKVLDGYRPLSGSEFGMGTHVLDSVLEMLIDGEWHRADALAEKLKLPPAGLRTILDFLSEHGFVQYQTSDGSVRIDAQLRAMMESRAYNSVALRQRQADIRYFPA